MHEPRPNYDPRQKTMETLHVIGSRTTVRRGNGPQAAEIIAAIHRSDENTAQPGVGLSRPVTPRTTNRAGSPANWLFNN